MHAGMSLTRCCGGQSLAPAALHGNTLNRARSAGDKIDERQRIAKALWLVFARAAHIVHAWGGIVSFEWPRACQYWGWDSVRRLKAELGMVDV